MIAPTCFGSLMVCRLGHFIPARVFLFGVWEPNLTAFLMRRLGPGDVFVDVGANIGYFSLLGAKLVGETGSVVAIEASPSIFKLLSANLSLNSASNVQALNVAVGDGPGIASIYAGPATDPGRTSILGGAGPIEETVRMDALDAILSPEQIARTRLIKIDIEGAEIPVLERILDRIAQFRPDLEIVTEIGASVIPLEAGRIERLSERFRSAGFNSYELENDYDWRVWMRSTPPISPPRRLHGLPPIPCDVVFSRVSAEVL